MAKYVPNPHNLALFKVVMAPSPGRKTEVTIYAVDSAEAKAKVEALWGFPVLTSKAVPVKEVPSPTPKPAKALPTLDVPSGYMYAVPEDVPLGLFTYCHAVAPTDEQAHAILLAFEQHVTKKLLVTTCTSDKRLLPDKPVDGVFAFIWQLARYMSGEETRIPTTAFIDLIDGTSKLTKLRVDPGAVKTIMKFLQTQAGHLVDAVGGDKRAGEKRWATAEGLAKNTIA
jgi:hypothetical protein